MAVKAMLSERLLLLLEREIDEFERLADLARAAEAPGADAGDAEGGRGDEVESAGIAAEAGAGATAVAGDRAKDAVGRRIAATRQAKSVAGLRSTGQVKAAASKAKTRPALRRAAGLPLGLAKERIDVLGQLTRTLEKLLDLKRLERLASESGQTDEAETRRLRAEFLARLKSLDRRRREGPTLFVGVDADAVFGGDG